MSSERGVVEHVHVHRRAMAQLGRVHDRVLHDVGILAAGHDEHVDARVPVERSPSCARRAGCGRSARSGCDHTRLMTPLSTIISANGSSTCNQSPRSPRNTSAMPRQIFDSAETGMNHSPPRWTYDQTSLSVGGEIGRRRRAAASVGASVVVPTGVVTVVGWRWRCRVAGARRHRGHGSWGFSWRARRWWSDGRVGRCVAGASASLRRRATPPTPRAGSPWRAGRQRRAGRSRCRRC